MPSDILTIALSAFAPDARPPAVRPVSPADEPELAVLYLRSYPPDIGAQNLDEARAEIKATFDGEFGVLRLDSSLVAVDSGRVVGAVLVVERSIWDDDLDGPFIIDLFVDPDADTAAVWSRPRSPRAPHAATRRCRSDSVRVPPRRRSGCTKASVSRNE